jgi:hypothetical protein
MAFSQWEAQLSFAPFTSKKSSWWPCIVVTKQNGNPWRCLECGSVGLQGPYSRSPRNFATTQIYCLSPLFTLCLTTNRMGGHTLGSWNLNTSPVHFCFKLWGWVFDNSNLFGMVVGITWTLILDPGRRTLDFASFDCTAWIQSRLQTMAWWRSTLCVYTCSIPRALYIAHCLHGWNGEVCIQFRR